MSRERQISSPWIKKAEKERMIKKGAIALIILMISIMFSIMSGGS
jgi:hypothetical protein